jgi:hypothetical protein
VLEVELVNMLKIELAVIIEVELAEGSEQVLLDTIGIEL